MKNQQFFVLRWLIFARLVTYSIYIYHKILMDCDNFHVKCDIMLFCLQAKVNASNIHT